MTDLDSGKTFWDRTTQNHSRLAQIHLEIGSGIINPDADDSYPRVLTIFKGHLYFSAESKDHGRELYRLSPGGTEPTLIDIDPGMDSSSPSDFVKANGKLYFAAHSRDQGREVYSLSSGSQEPRASDGKADSRGFGLG